MRPTVVLLVSSDRGAALHQRIRASGSYIPADFMDRLERDGCRFGIDASGSVIDEFEDDELSVIRAALGADAVAVTVEYPDDACLRSLLLEVLDGFDGLLDTNHGALLPFSEVFPHLAPGESWSPTRPTP